MDAERMNFDRKFDMIIAGDVLEHMSNPCLFLQQVSSLLSDGGELIIAVSHAFTFVAIRVWLFQKENVHRIIVFIILRNV
jgi:2-polyprenyl-3-methyl-5-hydroxy-6-metoxy-1,4-benzoquinol methylase